MASVIQTTFVLTGPLAGKNTNLGSQGYPFRAGKLTINATPEETALHARFLQRNWQAYPEGHPKLEEVLHVQRDIPPNTQQDEQPPVPGGGEPEGEGADPGVEKDEGAGATETETREAGSVPAGDGQPEELINAKLLKAVNSLDPKDDNHWTKDGKPAMTAVEKLYGAADVTRADVEAVAPGHTRPTE